MSDRRQILKSLLIGISTLAFYGQPSLAAPNWTASPERVGPLRFGMSPSEAFSALGEPTPVKADALIACMEWLVPGVTDTVMMFENDRLSRISLYGQSPVKTTHGIGIGAIESEVLSQYPKITSVPRGDPEALARDMTLWKKPNRSGIRFQTDNNRVVEVINIGGPAIAYTSGCP